MFAKESWRKIPVLRLGKTSIDRHSRMREAAIQYNTSIHTKETTSLKSHLTVAASF